MRDDDGTWGRFSECAAAKRAKPWQMAGLKAVRWGRQPSVAAYLLLLSALDHADTVTALIRVEPPPKVAGATG